MLTYFCFTLFWLLTLQRSSCPRTFCQCSPGLACFQSVSSSSSQPINRRVTFEEIDWWIDWFWALTMALFTYTHSSGIKWKLGVKNLHWELWECCFSYMLSSESSGPILLSNLLLLIFCLQMEDVSHWCEVSWSIYWESFCFYWKE